MNGLKVVFAQNGEDLLRKDGGVGHAMRQVAAQVRDRVNAPSNQAVSIRAGVGRRGAFSQVIMRGPGALTIEFGSRTRKALAPLRNALRGKR